MRLIVAGVVARGQASTAATWRVSPDPDNPVDRVGLVVATASSGDTVLVEAGTYYEHISVGSKSLTFIGLGGAENTILDGSRAIPGREGAILYRHGEYPPADLYIHGFTLQHGLGRGTFPDLRGGAISWDDNLYGGVFDVEDCRFLENGGNPYPYTNLGGAVFVYDVSSTKIAHCFFRDNVAYDQGGAVFLAPAAGVAAEVSDCVFELKAGDNGDGAAIWADNGLDFIMRRCVVEASWNDDAMRAIYCNPRDATLEGNTFIDHDGTFATRLIFTYAGTYPAPRQYLTMTRNVFWSASATAVGDGLQVLGSYAMNLTANTFVGTDVLVELGAGHTIDCLNNIFCHTTTSFYCLGTGFAGCNDSWPDTLGLFSGGIETRDNISADPLFCDLEAGDFHIAHQSPCAEGQAPPGCGRIGSLGEACDVIVGACCLEGTRCVPTTPAECQRQGGTYLGDGISCVPNPCVPIAVRTLSWGRIKTLFRDATR